MVYILNVNRLDRIYYLTSFLQTFTFVYTSCITGLRGLSDSAYISSIRDWEHKMLSEIVDVATKTTPVPFSTLTKWHFAKFPSYGHPRQFLSSLDLFSKSDNEDVNLELLCLLYNLDGPCDVICTEEMHRLLPQPALILTLVQNLPLNGNAKCLTYFQELGMTILILMMKGQHSFIHSNNNQYLAGKMKP
jgi:hypothetical protein